MKTILKLIAIGLLLLVLASCAMLFTEPAIPSVPAPTAPIELQVLPRSARIGCIDHPTLGPSGVSVWELPGVKPSDPDSAYMGDRGKWLGAVPCQTGVTITSYAWSETDQEFWAYIKASDGLKGWVTLAQLDLSP